MHFSSKACISQPVSGQDKGEIEPIWTWESQLTNGLLLTTISKKYTSPKIVQIALNYKIRAFVLESQN